MGKNDIITNHESFGVITVHRATCGRDGIPLFDSPLKHHNVIQFEVRGAEHHRSLSRNWIMPTDSKVCVYMSEAQFGRMVSSAGLGEGVPCTIMRFNGQKVEDLPAVEGVKQVFDKELKATVREATKSLDTANKMIRDLLSKPRVTKGELESLKGLLEKSQQEMLSNVPFVEHQFERTLDHAVNQAKTEIDSHLAHSLQNLGLNNVKGLSEKEIVMLPDGVDK